MSQFNVIDKEEARQYFNVLIYVKLKIKKKRYRCHKLCVKFEFLLGYVNILVLAARKGAHHLPYQKWKLQKARINKLLGTTVN